MYHTITYQGNANHEADSRICRLAEKLGFEETGSGFNFDPPQRDISFLTSHPSANDSEVIHFRTKAKRIGRRYGLNIRFTSGNSPLIYPWPVLERHNV